MTREQAEDTIEGLQELISRGLQSVYLDMALAGMRQLLAAMDSEPVAYMYDGEDGREYNGHNEFSGGGKGIPLYSHAQQPVVPEDKPMPNPLSMYAVDAVAAIAEVKGWNACRAAMLQAGNSPVIPGWIPVSERMPDEGETVLGCCGLNGRHSGVYTMRASVIYRKNSATDTYGIKHERVTHWMPLPAAPQEVK